MPEPINETTVWRVFLEYFRKECDLPLEGVCVENMTDLVVVVRFAV